MNELEKKRIITLCGRPGSGKSTASKGLAAELGYEHFSSGDLFRAIGKEKGIDVYQTNVLAKTEASIDEMVDQRLRDIGVQQDMVVIDSRTAWHWIPQSYKVFLDLDLAVAAKRILANMDPERIAVEHIPEDPAKYAERLQARLDEEAERYDAKYSVNPYDLSNYDLVVDTEANSAAEVVELVMRSYKEWLGEGSEHLG